MIWNKINHIDNLNCKIEIPTEWLLPHYYEAVNVLFRFENTLRVFAYIILKKNLGMKWADISIDSEDNTQSTLKAIAKKRQSQDSNFGYLGYTFSSPMLYLTSGELFKMITHDSYWKYFKNWFLGSKEIIKNKFEEIINVRNAFAHFRPLKQDDVEVVKQNILHLMNKIENQIGQIINNNDRVPSNTKDEWYQSLKSLGNELCNTTFFQSQDREWIRITLIFNCPVNWFRRFVSKRIMVDTFTIETIPILLKYKELSNNSIYISETIPSLYQSSNWKSSINKRINFLFPREILQSNFSLLEDNFKNLLDDIKNEVEMIQQDNMARGELVHSVRLYGFSEQLEDGSLNVDIDTSDLSSIENEEVLPEFWGQISYFSGKHYLSHATQFPWMSERISNIEDIEF
jgi:hypothetical protein